MPVGMQPKPGTRTHILMVAPDFFATMQIPLLLGRGDQRSRPARLA